MARFLDSDDLIAVADHCVGTLRALSDRNWSIRATNDERSCREVIEHVCCLSYAPILALRAPDWIDLAFGVARGTPIEWVLVSAHTTAVILAEVARAAPPTVRGYHPCGSADPEGFVSMMACEFMLHTSDIATAFEAPFRPDDFSTRAVLERLFPWWPKQEDPWSALLWASGRLPSLGGTAGLGDRWAWHCSPLADWDGTRPEWDSVTGTKVTH